MVRYEPGYGRAQGRATADREPDQPQRGRIVTGTPSDIGNNQRKQHPEHRRPEPVKELYRNNQIRIGNFSKQNATYRQGTKAQQKDRPAAPNLGGPPGPRRQQRGDDLGPTMHAAMTNGA